MANKFILGAILLVILSSSVYLILNNEVKMNVTNTKTSFYIYENGWILSGEEYSALSSGKIIYKNVNYAVDGNKTTIIRTYQYNNSKKSVLQDVYSFDGNIKSKESFPISHQIVLANASGLTYKYKAKRLDYNGENIENVSSPQRFGRKMEIEFEKPDSSKLKNLSSGGQLELNYKIISDYQIVRIRLFDPDPCTPPGSGIWNISDGQNVLCENVVVMPPFSTRINDTALLTIINSNMTNNIDIYNYGNITALNSNFTGTISSYDNTTANFTNCNVSAINLYGYGQKQKTYVSYSFVKTFTDQGGNYIQIQSSNFSSYRFGVSLTTNMIHNFTSLSILNIVTIRQNSTIYGYIDFPATFTNQSTTGTMARYYPVRVVYATNTSRGVANLTVNFTRNADSAVMSSVGTDENGWSNPYNTFNKTNFDPVNWAILVSDETDVNTSVGVVTDTPITLISNRDEPVTDTCTAPAINNDWIVHWNDNCTISGNVNLGTGKLIINGTGDFIINSNITAHGTQFTCTNQPCRIINQNLIKLT